MKSTPPTPSYVQIFKLVNGKWEGMCSLMKNGFYYEILDSHNNMITSSNELTNFLYILNNLLIEDKQGITHSPTPYYQLPPELTELAANAGFTTDTNTGIIYATDKKFRFLLSKDFIRWDSPEGSKEFNILPDAQIKLLKEILPQIKPEMTAEQIDDIFSEHSLGHDTNEFDEPPVPSGDTYKKHGDEPSAMLIELNFKDTSLLEECGFVWTPKENHYYKNKETGDTIRFSDTGKAEYYNATKFLGKQFDSIPEALKFIVREYFDKSNEPKKDDNVAPISNANYKMISLGENSDFMKLNDQDTELLNKLGFAWDGKKYVKPILKINPNELTEVNEPDLIYEVIYTFNSGNAKWILSTDSKGLTDVIEKYDGIIAEVLTFVWNKWKNKISSDDKSKENKLNPVPRYNYNTLKSGETVMAIPLGELDANGLIFHGFTYTAKFGYPMYIRGVSENFVAFNNNTAHYTYNDTKGVSQSMEFDSVYKALIYVTSLKDPVKNTSSKISNKLVRSLKDIGFDELTSTTSNIKRYSRKVENKNIWQEIIIFHEQNIELRVIDHNNKVVGYKTWNDLKLGLVDILDPKEFRIIRLRLNAPLESELVKNGFIFSENNGSYEMNYVVGADNIVLNFHPDNTASASYMKYKGPGHYGGVWWKQFNSFEEAVKWSQEGKTLVTNKTHTEPEDKPNDKVVDPSEIKKVMDNIGFEYFDTNMEGINSIVKYKNKSSDKQFYIFSNGNVLYWYRIGLGWNSQKFSTWEEFLEFLRDTGMLPKEKSGPPASPVSKFDYKQDGLNKGISPEQSIRLTKEDESIMNDLGFKFVDQFTYRYFNNKTGEIATFHSNGRCMLYKQGEAKVEYNTPQELITELWYKYKLNEPEETPKPSNTGGEVHPNVINALKGMGFTKLPTSTGYFYTKHDSQLVHSIEIKPEVDTINYYSGINNPMNTMVDSWELPTKIALERLKGMFPIKENYYKSLMNAMYN
jgi:hypothetical protein